MRKAIFAAIVSNQHAATVVAISPLGASPTPTRWSSHRSFSILGSLRLPCTTALPIDQADHHPDTSPISETASAAALRFSKLPPPLTATIESPLCSAPANQVQLGLHVTEHRELPPESKNRNSTHIACNRGCIRVQTTSRIKSSKKGKARSVSGSAESAPAEM